MQNPIRFNFGGKILFNDRSNKEAIVSFLETSGVSEIKNYVYELQSLNNTPDTFPSTESNYSLLTDVYGSGLYNRVHIHPTSSAITLSDDPTENFTLARPNSLINIDDLYNSNLTFNIRTSVY